MDLGRKGKTAIVSSSRAGIAGGSGGFRWRANAGNERFLTSIFW